MTNKKLLTVEEAAGYLGVSKWSLYGWHRKGEGPDRIRLGGSIRYAQSTVDDWIDDNVEPAQTA